MPLVLHKSLEGSSEPCSKPSVLEGFVAKRSSPPADQRQRGLLSLSGYDKLKCCCGVCTQAAGENVPCHRS